MMTLNIYFKCNIFNKGHACTGGRVRIPSTAQEKENFEGTL